MNQYAMGKAIFDLRRIKFIDNEICKKGECYVQYSFADTLGWLGGWVSVGDIACHIFQDWRK